MSDDLKAKSLAALEAWSRRDFESFASYFAPDAYNHDPYEPFPGQGADGIKRSAEYFSKGMPDFRMEVLDQVVGDNKVATRFMATGTHLGDIMGVPATGRTVRVGGIVIDRFEHGLIKELWVYFDSLAFMQQIGAVQFPAGTEAGSEAKNRSSAT